MTRRGMVTVFLVLWKPFSATSQEDQLLAEEPKQVQSKQTELRASWYGGNFHGRLMSEGEVFNKKNPHIAASNSLPPGTVLFLRNPETNHSLWVEIKDRMADGTPKDHIDLSEAGAVTLGFKEKGLAKLVVELIRN